MAGPLVTGGSTALKVLLAVLLLALAIAVANLAGRRIGGQVPPPSEGDAAGLYQGE
jgi:hypothetical protein